VTNPRYSLLGNDSGFPVEIISLGKMHNIRVKEVSGRKHTLEFNYIQTLTFRLS
jgi:hypothetical protein